MGLLWIAICNVNVTTDSNGNAACQILPLTLKAPQAASRNPSLPSAAAAAADAAAARCRRLALPLWLPDAAAAAAAMRRFLWRGGCCCCRCMLAGTLGVVRLLPSTEHMKCNIATSSCWWCVRIASGVSVRPPAVQNFDQTHTPHSI